MGIIEEIKAAEIESACEFSQDVWENSLLKAWKEDRTLSYAIAAASGLAEISSETWEKLFKRARMVKPPVMEFVSGKNRVRVWIAQNATFANHSLWDGNWDRAKSLLRRGGIAHSGRRMTINEVKKEMKKDSALIVVGGKGSDKRHDWNTCK